MKKTTNRKLSKIRHRRTRTRTRTRTLKNTKRVKTRRRVGGKTKNRVKRTLRRVKKNKGGFFYNKCKDVKIEDLAAGYKSIESLDALHSLYQRCCPSTNLGFTKIKNKTALCKAIDKRANMLIKEENDQADVNPDPTPNVHHYDKTQPGPSIKGKIKSFIQPSMVKSYAPVSNK